MPIRMTGLTSGLDTESIVNQLMSAQRTKQTKVESKKQKLEWKQEIWKGLNTKLYGFYKDSLSKMRFKSNYATKKASVSDSTKLTATATSSAAAGSYQVEIQSIASSQYVTSDKLKGTKNEDGTFNEATAKTKLVNLCDSDGNKTFTSGAEIKISGQKDVSLTVTDSTTIDDFLSKCKEAGLNATFDTKQQRLFISSQKSGSANKFTIKVDGETKGFTEEGKQAISSIKSAVGYSFLDAAKNDTEAGSSSDINKGSVDSIINGLLTGDNTAISNENLKTLQDASETSAKKKATSFFEAVASVQTVSDDEIKAELEKQDGYSSLSDSEKAKKLSEAKQAKKEEMAASVILGGDTTYSGTTDKEKAINKLMEKGITSADVEAKLGSSTNAANYTIDAKDKRTENVQNAVKAYNDLLTAGDGNTNKATINYSGGNALKSLGLEEGIDGTAKAEQTDSNGKTYGMVVSEAADTTVKYNGATLTSDNTSIEVAGVTLNLLGKTAAGETVNVTVSNDTSAVYDSIKEFITEYNSILKTMNTYYDAASASSYDVLTDDQKEAMSDDEVDKWNTKIKDSLLRRDSTLSSLISVMKTDMMGTVKASNGKTYSLANLGISTSAKNYSEGGLLHIKGDEDDEEFGESTNTLMQMLEEDPDTVNEVLSGLASNLYDSLNKKMSTTTMSSALTFYNDKEMASQLSDYKKEISDWESKLSDMEEKYYSQFSAMETALAKLQSQQSTLSSYLGS